jgi:arsenate reductase
MIYHNPRCMKCRQAMELLHERGIEPEVIEYLKAPPAAAELLALCRKMKLRPTQIIRTKEERFAELGLSLDDDRSDEEWCSILSENPVLIQRPIIVHGDRVTLGRSLDAICEIL